MNHVTHPNTHTHKDAQTQTRTQAQTNPCMIPMRAYPPVCKAYAINECVLGCKMIHSTYTYMGRLSGFSDQLPHRATFMGACMLIAYMCITASRNGKHQQQPHRLKIPWHPPSRPLPFYSIPVLPMQHEAEKEAQEVRINRWEGPAAEDKHLLANVVRRYVHTAYMGRS